VKIWYLKSEVETKATYTGMIWKKTGYFIVMVMFCTIRKFRRLRYNSDLWSSHLTHTERHCLVSLKPSPRYINCSHNANLEEHIHLYMFGSLFTYIIYTSEHVRLHYKIKKLKPRCILHVELVYSSFKQQHEWQSFWL